MHNNYSLLLGHIFLPYTTLKMWPSKKLYIIMLVRFVTNAHDIKAHNSESRGQEEPATTE